MLLWLNNRISAFYLILGFSLHLPDSLQQYTGRLIVRVLWHQFATEGFGENRWRQFLDFSAGGGAAGFEAVGIGEQRFDLADDFGLFFYGWHFD